LERNYAEIRLIHVAPVCASGGLFFLRGLAPSMFSSSWDIAAPIISWRDWRP
jgi:hypothetical protein